MATVINQELRNEEGYVVEPFAWSKATLSRARSEATYTKPHERDYPRWAREIEIRLLPNEEAFNKIELEGATRAFRDYGPFGYGRYKVTARLELIGKPIRTRTGWLARYRSECSNPRWVREVQY